MSPVGYEARSLGFNKLCYRRLLHNLKRQEMWLSLFRKSLWVPPNPGEWFSANYSLEKWNLKSRCFSAHVLQRPCWPHCVLFTHPFSRRARSSEQARAGPRADGGIGAGLWQRGAFSQTPELPWWGACPPEPGHTALLAPGHLGRCLQPPGFCFWGMRMGVAGWESART